MVEIHVKLLNNIFIKEDKSATNQSYEFKCFNNVLKLKQQQVTVSHSSIHQIDSYQWYFRQKPTGITDIFQIQVSTCYLYRAEQYRQYESFHTFLWLSPEIIILELQVLTVGEFLHVIHAVMNF